jgi:hypothetical protein
LADTAQTTGTQISTKHNSPLLADCRLSVNASQLRRVCLRSVIRMSAGASVALASELVEGAGVVEHGLFLGLATDLVVAGEGGVTDRRRERLDRADTADRSRAHETGG